MGGNLRDHCILYKKSQNYQSALITKKYLTQLKVDAKIMKI